LRVFISILLPQKQRQAISDRIDSIRAETAKMIKWVDPATLHITLKFCGECEENIVEEIKNQLNNLKQQGSFTLHTEDIDAFPNINKPNIIWTRIQGDLGPLKLLQKEVENATSNAGVEIERSPFHPHLTLGRVKRHTVLSQTIINKMKNSELVLEPWLVEEVALIKSELTQSGPIHEILGLFKI
jgi:2'-5' RNA ligase